MQVDAFCEAGWSKAAACRMVGCSRSGYYAARRVRCSARAAPDPSDQALVERIRPIVEAHPFWGYRRVWAWLRYRESMGGVNKKRVYRLMREGGLTVKSVRHAAVRTPRAKPRATRPKQYWGIDMTKFLIPTLGWGCLVVVLDWYTKKIVGWDLSLRSRRQEWEAALMMGLQAEFPQGARGAGLKLVSDNGSQPTSTGFMANMKIVDITQIFTSYDNPKGNAETERVMRTIKEELLWLQEFPNLETAREAIKAWIAIDYNQRYVHSALGYKSPLEFEQAWLATETQAA